MDFAKIFQDLSSFAFVINPLTTFLGFLMVGNGALILTRSANSGERTENSAGITYLILGGMLVSFDTLLKAASATFLGIDPTSSLSMVNSGMSGLGWPAAGSKLNGTSVEALKLAVLIVRLTGFYCFISAVGQVKEFSRNQNYDKLNSGKVRFFASVFLMNFPTVMHFFANNVLTGKPQEILKGIFG